MSSSTIGTLMIDMVANVARLQQDMDAAKKAVNESMQSITAAVDLAKKAMLAFAGVASIDAFAGMIKGSIEAAASMARLSTVAGTTIEAMSGLAAVGKITGTSAEEIAGAMNKMTRAMAGTDANAKGVAAGIKAIGLDFDSFMAMTPDQRMVAVAQAMDNFQDGAGKSGVAMAIMGKTGAAMLPYLKELATVGELHAKVTREQALQAKDFEENLKRLKVSGEAWKKELAMGMLPALDEASKALLSVINGSGGLRAEIHKLSADGSIAEWTRTAITGLTYLADSVQYIMRFATLLGELVGAVMADVAQKIGAIGKAFVQMIRGNYSDAFDTLKGSIRATGVMSDEFRAKVSAAFSDETFGQKIRARMADLKGVTEEVKKQKELVDPNFNKAAKAAKGGNDEFQKFIDQIQKQIDLQDAMIMQGEKITPMEKLQVEMYSALAASSRAYTLTELLEIDAMFELLKDKEKLVLKNAEETKATLAANEAHVKYLVTLDAEIKKTQGEIDAVRQHTTEMGLSKGAIGELEMARIEEKAALIETQAAREYEKNLNDSEYNDKLRLAQLMRDLGRARRDAGIKEDEVARFKSLWDSVDKTAQGVFTNIFQGGQSAFTKLRDTLKATLLDLLYQMTARKWLFDITASVTGQSGGVAGAVGQAAGIGNSMGGLGGLIGGGSSLANMGGSMFANATGTGLDGLLATNGAFGTAAGGAGLMGTIGTALPYIGVALAVASLLSKRGGGPKTEGGFSAGGLSIAGADIGGSQQGSVRGDVSGAQSISQGISQSYETLATQLGLVNKKLDVGVFFSKDNAAGGTSLTQLQITSSAGYNRGATAGGIENVGRTDPEFQAAITDATSQLLLQALKNSDLAAQYKQMLNGIADNAGSAEIQAAIAHVTAAKTQQAQLTEQIYQMTATAEEKLARTRLQERAAIDPLNAALLEQLYAKQDAMQAEAAATAAATQAAKDQAAAQTALAAAQAQATAALKTATDTALSGLQNSITAARQVAAQQVQDLTALSSLLGSSIGQLTGTTSGGAGSSFIAKALSAAKTTGYLPDVTQLQGAITGATAGVSNTGNYKSAQEQEFARMVLAGQLSQLKDLTDPQLTAAQQQVKYLDGILEDAQKQVDALRGIDNSVKSVAVAIAALRAAILNEKAGGAAAAAVAAVKAAVGPNFAGIQSGGNAAPILTDAMMHPGFAYQGGDVPLAFQAQWGMNDPRGNNWTGPSFADGTPQILQTGLAMVHKDEAIIPASAAQKWRDGGDDDGGKLAARIEQLIQVCTQVVINTRTTADVFRQAQTVSGGMALAVTTVAAGT